jgi:anti-sigma factor RsiW
VTETTCSEPVPFEVLVDYWTGDLDPGAGARVEAHVFACATCARRLEDVAALGRSIATAVRAGHFQAVVSDGLINTLSRDGLRLRTYTLEPGAVVPCGVWSDDDLVVTRLRGDFGGLESVSVVMRGPTGFEVSRSGDLPVRPGQQELVRATSAARLRELPAVRLTILITGRSVDGQTRTVGEYTLEHGGTFRREARAGDLP